MTQLLIAAGGALGTALRYALGAALLERFGSGFPYGTLAVNLIGSCALGAVYEGLSGHGPAEVNLRLVLGVGVMGGFTTYSSFNLELLRLIEQQALARAAVYLASTLFGCLLAGAAGIAITRMLLSR